MINANINKLSKLLNSPILTPYNLLENLELDNYLSINYYKEDEYIKADIKFLSCGSEVVFRYIFSEDNLLQKIYHVDGEKLILHFDRTQEKEELILQLRRNVELEQCV